MRPIAHARRLFSRAASSRHAVDAVVIGYRVPIGIPALSSPTSSYATVRQSKF